MEKFIYPKLSVRCIITGPNECGKNYFLTSLNTNNIKEFAETYIFSPSVHQDLYRKLFKSFSIYIPLQIIPSNINEEDIDIVIEEIVKNKDCKKSDTEGKTYETIDELKYPQDYKDNDTFILDQLNEKRKHDLRVQALFK